MAHSRAAALKKVLRSISDQARSLKIKTPPSVDNCRFIENYYRHAADDDIAGSPATLAASAVGHLAWATERRVGRAKVRAFNPTSEADGWTSQHTIVQTVTDDSPFIVDSLTMQLNSGGHGVLIKIHPIVQVERDKNGRLKRITDAGDGAARSESWAHFEIPRVIEQTALADIERQLLATLRDVKLAVRDWKKMLTALQRAATQLRESSSGRRETVAESAEFLDWLAQNHFTLLGYCRYRSAGSKALQPVAESGLGLLRRSRGWQDKVSVAEVPSARNGKRDPLIITKAPIQSTIHRPAPLDDISIKVLNGSDKELVEHRFLGLFTSVAYNESPNDIPLLRMKVRKVIEESGLQLVSHRGKALTHILDTLPRDELIQASLTDLKRMALGILDIDERRKTKLFCRRDTREDFYSCLLYLPRDQYSRPTRTRIESLLENRLGGHVADSQLTVSESTLARLHITIRIDAATPGKPDVQKLEAEIREAVLTWSDRVRESLLEQMSEIEALAAHDRFAGAFPASYQEAVSPARACRDMPMISATLAGAEFPEMALDALSDSRLVFTVIRPDNPIELYRANPILEHMGLKVVKENNYALAFGSRSVWIQDFELESADIRAGDATRLAERFRECFARTLRGEVENDSFNRLVVSADLNWREAELLRAYCKYLLQSRLRFSQAYMLETLVQYPALARALVDLFASYFDPDLEDSTRSSQRDSSQRVVREELDRAVSLDEDRILRAFASVVEATLRTNYYRLGDDAAARPYISFKLDPGKVPDLPRPRPKFEIFVYSERVEGVHLRCGMIARGGLRWSDRREDFRTEVLGLMKAQQVKNTVIVPTGAKGGFVCKRLPSGDRIAIQTEVVECYKTFVRGMLDLTDNIVAERTITPSRVLPRDGSDPYLVVAADKGTATFSDIANGLSHEYGFWLGDAFASGGSAGYDHKKMGITARGAWESVKRHFRELGADTQSEEFTVVGIGDMGGDVFGNGMLLSPHIRLVAAFNHQHIFIDPEPDAATGFAERKRLFELPRSSWADYDRAALSKGGGIYERKSKAIELSAAARAALSIDQATITPPELIRAILTAPVDLLWNGGIGTYVKASHESDLDAGDPANDQVRVNGESLRCRVIGEGGNLGLTQLARVEYALQGGRINTDFIDNSGGVDSSDREVNIKILLSDAIVAGKLLPGRRDALLAGMTDSVAGLVLASNYAQTQALSMMAAHVGERIGELARLMRILEGKGLLDRAIESLPNDEEIEERKKSGLGLTRPELAVVLSYAKIHLFEELVASDIPEDPHCASELLAYFPERLRKRFGELIPKHRLHREISAMLISSSMINRMGPFFVLRAQEDTGAGVSQVARAYAIVRGLFATRKLWRNIESLDGVVQTNVQYDSFFEISRMVRRAVYWFLHRYPNKQDIDAVLGRMGTGVAALLESPPGLLCGLAKRRFEHDTKSFESLGMPREVGERIATTRLLPQLLDIVELSLAHRLDVEATGRLHFELGRGLRLDWLREQIEGLEVEGHWSAMARGTLRETLGQEQRALMTTVLDRAGRGDPNDALAQWLADANTRIARMKHTFDEMQTAERMDFATLSIALKELSRLR